MQGMRFLRKKRTTPARRTGRRGTSARRTASLSTPLAFIAGRVGGIATGPATFLGSIRGSVHAKGLVLWAAALATGILCVWQHVYAARLAGEIENLRQRRSRLEAEIGFLEMECVTLSSRDRIERYAMEHLGMRYPVRDEVIILGDATPAARAADYVMGDGIARNDG